VTSDDADLRPPPERDTPEPADGLSSRTVPERAGTPEQSASSIGPSPVEASNTDPAAPDPAKPKRASRWWELPVLAVLAIAVAVLVKTFLVQPFYIPSESMEPTLHGCTGCNGDKILVNKTIYDFRDPHPGDIIVFSEPEPWTEDPGSEATVAPHTNLITGPIRWFGQLVGVVPPDEEDLVKRVIATGGMKVKCCDAQGQVQVQDPGSTTWRSLVEPFLAQGSNTESSFDAVTVPEGRLWVMGDNRNNSADSRYHCQPGQETTVQKCVDVTRATVPVSNVVGKAFVIAWPVSRWRTLGTPSTFKASALGASAAPFGASAAVVGPVFLFGRRRRKRNRG
jgi:signal peptidase I